MSEMSLREQINCLKTMRSDLDSFCGEMHRTMDKFNEDIKYLRAQGLSIETEERYQKAYYTPAKDDVDQVVSDIYQFHFDYIDRIIERLERAASEE